MGDLSLTRRSEQAGLSRIAARTVVMAAAVLALTACAYSDPHQRYSHSYGYGYGSGARVAVGTHHPGVVYRTPGSRARAWPGHVAVPGRHHAAPRPGYKRKPPYVASRPSDKRRPAHIAPHVHATPGARPPHAPVRPDVNPPQRHVRPGAQSRAHPRAQHPVRSGRHVRPGHVQRAGDGSVGARRHDARRTATAGPNMRSRPPARSGHQRSGSRR